MTATFPSIEGLDALVRQVPGVDALYPARSLVATVLVATVLAATRNAVAEQTPPTPVVLVEQNVEGLRITAKIGITAAESSSEVCGRVHDAIAAHLRQGGNPKVTQIAVIVARIG